MNIYVNRYCEDQYITKFILLSELPCGLLSLYIFTENIVLYSDLVRRSCGLYIVKCTVLLPGRNVQNLAIKCCFRMEFAVWSNLAVEC